MKIFDWMQNKFNGTHGSKKPTSKSIQKHKVLEPGIEEFNEWPHGVLLAIGTLGTNNVDENLEKCKIFQGKTESSSSQQNLEGLTYDEDEELNTLISVHQQVDEQSAPAPELEQKGLFSNLPMEKSVKGESSLEAETESKNIDNAEESTSRVEDHQNSNNVVVLNRGKDACLDYTKKKAIGEKSLSFLLKKMFVCRSGFSPAPSLRDPIPESRMEKILRAMLKQKVYPQSSAPSIAAKKYLDHSNKPKSTKKEDQEFFEKTDDGSKWVKTDSEYIVLEM